MLVFFWSACVCTYVFVCVVYFCTDFVIKLIGKHQMITLYSPFLSLNNASTIRTGKTDELVIKAVIQW